MKNGKLKAVIVGLGFGGAFVPIWRDHPDVGEVGVCELDPKLCARVAAEYGISLIYPSLDEVLADETVDAVHLVTAIPDHAEQTVRVLDAGKHCACTVPMATTMEGIQAIRGAVERSGKKYMMMETTLYTYQYLYVKRLLESGELGRVQFLRGSHYQETWKTGPPTGQACPRRWKSSRTCRTTSLPSPSLSGATPSAATTIPPTRSSASKRVRAAAITAPTPTWFMSLSAALSRTALLKPKGAAAAGKARSHPYTIASHTKE